MGGGKLQERDVVGSLWVLPVFLSKHGAYRCCPSGRRSLCYWRRSVLCRTPSSPSSALGLLARRPSPHAWSPSLASISWSASGISAWVLPVAVPTLQGSGELLPAARGDRNSAVIHALVLGSFKINYQDCNAISHLFFLLFLKAVHGPWRFAAVVSVERLIIKIKQAE